MKILVIVPTLHRGGAERAVSRLSQAWQEAHEVLVTVFDSSMAAYPYGGNLVDLKCPAVNGIWGKLINSLRRISSLVSLIRKEKPDRIISFMESANFPAVLAALLTRSLSCLTVSVHDDPKRFIPIQRHLIPLLYRFPRCVVAVSQGVLLALEKMGIPQQKLFFIPNSSPGNQEKTENIKEENIRRPPRYVLGVGRLSPQKRFDRLMVAFAGIDDPSLCLVILGEGDERAGLETLAEELGINDRFMMPGAIGDIASWYENALCFVLSSEHEGWPTVLMEAMHYHCPVVSFDCRYGPSEIIESEVSGLLVPEGDVIALRSAIIKVINNETLRESFVKESLRKMKQYDVKNIAKMWLDSFA